MSIFNIGYSGAQAAQVHLNATAMNTANAQTIGYSRQRVEQSAVGSLGNTGLNAGYGVEVNAIRRIADQYLIGQTWRATSSYEYYGMTQKYLGPLETVLGDDATSLNSGMDKFFATLSEATTQPGSPALRQQIINEAKSLSMRFNNVNNFISQQKSDVQLQRGATVNQVNTLSSNIASYNQKIIELESTGASTSVLRDQRDELVKQMSSLMDVRISEDANGSFTVTMSSGQPLVSGKTASSLEVKTQSNGSQLLELSFSGSTFQVDMSTGGQLGALHDYEVGTLKDMQDAVVGMAESLATAFNDQLALGFDINGQPGKPLFNFNPNNPKGMLQINDMTADELALSSKNDEAGNGENLQALIEIKNQKMTIPGLGQQMSLNEAGASIISTIGITSRENQTEATSAESVLYQAESQRDSLSGVNMEEEALNLMTYTQAYQANLKIISTGDKIFSDLLSMF